MAKVLRGDVFWADLDPVRGHEQGGLRPVLILSHELFNAKSGTVIAVAITSQQPSAGFPLTLKVQALPKQSWIKISQIRTISSARLGKRIVHISNAELSQVVEGLLELIS
ncbi:MAG: type II toxin-antitoxin system PemK/MazF family toxin [Acidobacteriota bacterium]|nr:type II toxin-antitoxin system PemK/MazF family toxin [Acidobacteriota bacterium]